MIKFIIYLLKVILNKSKIFDFFIKKIKFNYPPEIRFQVKNIINKIPNYKQKKIDANKYKFLDIKKRKKDEDYIKLASIIINLKDKNFYKNISFDLENIDSFYRLSWIIKDLKDNNFEYFNYNLNEILNNLEIKFKHLFYHSYTISERLENIVFFCALTNISLSNNNMKILNKDINYLLNNLEFNIHGYNNHLFKNFKALYISGLFLGDSNFSNLFKKNIFNYFNNFVDPDLLLNEGSSNYIILFYKWCHDILFFSKLYSDKEMCKFIELKINKMNKYIGIFFLNNDFNDSDFVKFGDISPDYNFDFIKAYIEFILKFCNEKTISLNNVNFANVDTNINSWIKKQLYNTDIISRKINLNKICYHEHSDFFHFIFAYKNICIFTDSGNKNYNEDNKRNEYKSLKSHNSIIIDNLKYRNKWSMYFNSKNKYHTKFISEDTINYIFENKNSIISRDIKILPKGIKITDNLNIYKKSKKIETIFQLNPKIKIQTISNNKFLFQIQEMQIIFSIKTKAKFLTEIKNNFYSSEYGLEQKKEYIRIIFKNIKELEANYLLEEQI